MLEITDINSDGISELLMIGKTYEEEPCYTCENISNCSGVLVYVDEYGNEVECSDCPVGVSCQCKTIIPLGRRLYLADRSGTVIQDLGHLDIPQYFYRPHAIVADIDADCTPDLLNTR